MKVNLYKANNNIFFIALLTFSLVGYVVLGYFTVRSNFYQVFSLFGILFIAYYFLMIFTDKNKINTLILFSFIARLSLLFMVPNLSDDYFRFIWDGRILAHGHNPYLYLPIKISGTSFFIENNLTKELFEGLNSKIYYTCYPPVHQSIFGLSSFLFPDNILNNIVMLRSIIIIAETGTIFLLAKVLKVFKLKKNRVLIYALNPLVIIELTGNLHFEAVMILFLMLSIYFLFTENYLVSAFMLSFAAGTKLLPLIFIPLFIKKIGIKKGFIFGATVTITLVLMYLPFINQYLIQNIFSSINLFFQKFEFNASIYYFIRWIGYLSAGYNIVSIAGTILSLLALVTIICISSFCKIKNYISFFQCVVFIITTYFLFATTVHPWYIVTLIALSIFTPYRFAIVWSALCILSYYAYRTLPVKENLWLISIEYIIVAFYFIYEYRKNHFSNLKSIPQNNFQN